MCIKIDLQNLIVREATKSDISDLASLFNLDYIIDLSDNKIVFLAILKSKENKEQIVGYCNLNCIEDIVDIVFIEVDEKYRNNGIGNILLGEVIQILKKREVKKIFLEVRKSNTFALKLYIKLGFDDMGIRKDYYSRPIEDAISMYMELPS